MDLFNRKKNNPDVRLPDVPLRDYFAGEALCAILSNQGVSTDMMRRFGQSPEAVEKGIEAVAKSAYQMADGMLKARGL